MKNGYRVRPVRLTSSAAVESIARSLIDNQYRGCVAEMAYRIAQALGFKPEPENVKLSAVWWKNGKVKEIQTWMNKTKRKP